MNKYMPITFQPLQIINDIFFIVLDNINGNG